MNRRLVVGLAILVGAGLPAPTLSAPAPALAPASRNTVDAYVAALARLQLADARLQSVGWRLTTGNARFCPDARPEVGLLLQDMMNYNAPGALRAAAGIQGDIAVQAVAEGSPAALAGLAANDEIVAIGGQDLARLPPPEPGDHRRLIALQGLIDAELARTGRIELRLRGKDGATRDVPLVGLPACPSRFELLIGKSSAQADGSRVVIGDHLDKTRRPADALGEEEYAALVAHELAHNLLRHREWLDQAGRSWGRVKRTEREADRLAIWLLANAGFDPEAGPRLMASWGRRTDPGFLSLPTHDGWKERLELMQREVARIHAALQERGLADWSRDFIREPDTKTSDAPRKIG